MDWVDTASLDDAYFKILGIIQEERRDEAIALLERLTTRFPCAEGALSTLAYLYTGKGRYLDAVRLFERAIAENATPNEIRNCVAHRTQIAFKMMDGEPFNGEAAAGV